jgi:hypothetical protein
MMNELFVIACQFDELVADLNQLRTLLPNDAQALEHLDVAIAQASRGAELLRSRSMELAPPRWQSNPELRIRSRFSALQGKPR